MGLPKIAKNRHRPNHWTRPKHYYFIVLMYDLQFGHPIKMFRSHTVFRFAKAGRPVGKKIEKKTKQERSSRGKPGLEGRMTLIRFNFFCLIFRREDGSVGRWEAFYRNGIKRLLKELCHEIHHILNSGSFHQTECNINITTQNNKRMYK